MTSTLAFDVYGTLINPHGVVEALQTVIGERAPEFSACWREKQLEYSFRRGLMQHYVPFSQCTAHAFDYAVARFKAQALIAHRQSLLDAYAMLPAFDDVKPALEHLKSLGFRLFAFSNGTGQAVSEVLANAGLLSLFESIVSTDDIRSFKPNPAAYAHFLRQAGSSHATSWLISSNPFDVIGALSCGMRSAWVRRSEQVIFDPWGIEPTTIVSQLDQLHGELSRDSSTVQSSNPAGFANP